MTPPKLWYIQPPNASTAGAAKIQCRMWNTLSPLVVTLLGKMTHMCSSMAVVPRAFSMPLRGCRRTTCRGFVHRDNIMRRNDAENITKLTHRFRPIMINKLKFNHN